MNSNTSSSYLLAHKTTLVEMSPFCKYLKTKFLIYCINNYADLSDFQASICPTQAYSPLLSLLTKASLE